MLGVLFGILALGVRVPRAVADFDYDAYKASSLAQVQKDQKETQGGDWNITASAAFKYRIRVVFSGELRPIDGGKKILVSRWAKALRLDQNVAGMFQHEIRVLEAGTIYWLPIQEQLIQPLRDEAIGNAACDFFVTWIGSTRTDFVFLINDFQALGAKE